MARSFSYVPLGPCEAGKEMLGQATGLAIDKFPRG